MRILLIIAMSVMAFSGFANAQPAAASGASAPNPAGAGGNSTSNAIIASPLPPNPLGAGVDNSLIEERKAWIVALHKFSESTPKEGVDWQPILNTVAGGLLAGLVAILTLLIGARREDARDKLRMKHEIAIKENEAKQQMALARMEGRFKYIEKLHESRLKLLELFLSPFLALLKQSDGLYEKLKIQLSQDSENYRLIENSARHNSRKILQVLWPKDHQWYDFRLLDQLPKLKQQVEHRLIIDEIMRIGKQMSILIISHGGLAVNEEGVVEAYAKYQTHYTILETIYKSSGTEATSPGQHQMGYYPRELNGIVENLYNKSSLGAETIL